MRSRKWAQLLACGLALLYVLAKLYQTGGQGPPPIIFPTASAPSAASASSTPSAPSAPSSDMTLLDRLAAFEAKEIVSPKSVVTQSPAPTIIKSPKEDIRAQMAKELEGHITASTPPSFDLPTTNATVSKTLPPTMTSMAAPDMTHTTGSSDLAEKLKQDWLNWSCGVFDQSVGNLKAASKALTEQVEAARLDEKDGVKKVLDEYDRFTCPLSEWKTPGATTSPAVNATSSTNAITALTPPADLHTFAEKFNRTFAAARDEMRALSEELELADDIVKQCMERIAEGERARKDLKRAVADFTQLIDDEINKTNGFTVENETEMEKLEQEAKAAMEQDLLANLNEFM